MDDSYKMRVLYEVRGGHTHIRIFTGKTALGKAGDLCMTNEEFEAWMSGRITMEWGRERSPRSTNRSGMGPIGTENADDAL